MPRSVRKHGGDIALRRSPDFDLRDFLPPGTSSTTTEFVFSVEM
jgi:hypothetical protein